MEDQEDQPIETAPAAEIKKPQFDLWKIIKAGLPLMVAVTFIFGLIYIVGQQSYRHSANDPQIQLAEDAALALSKGQAPESLIGNNKINIAHSLSPYVIICDQSGQPVASSALLDDQTPKIPPGIFEYTKRHKQDRITWEPKPGVRQAAVIVHYEGQASGFVFAGKSLRETEMRIGQLSAICIICWGIALFTIMVVIVGLEFLKSS
jgi:hypothetical protein